MLLWTGINLIQMVSLNRSSDSQPADALLTLGLLGGTDSVKDVINILFPFQLLTTRFYLCVVNVNITFPPSGFTVSVGLMFINMQT